MNSPLQVEHPLETAFKGFHESAFSKCSTKGHPHKVEDGVLRNLGQQQSIIICILQRALRDALNALS